MTHTSQTSERGVRFRVRCHEAFHVRFSFFVFRFFNKGRPHPSNWKGGGTRCRPHSARSTSFYLPGIVGWGMGTVSSHRAD